MGHTLAERGHRPPAGRGASRHRTGPGPRGQGPDAEGASRGRADPWANTKAADRPATRAGGVSPQERRPARAQPARGSGADARAAAALAVHRVRDRGQSLTRVLQQSPLPHPPADRALTQELIYGTLRCLPRLEAVVGLLLNHPVKPRDRDLEALILIGLYQLIVLETPDHAAVAATVEAVRLLGKPEKAPLVNALLRRFLRERTTLLAAADALPSVRWLFPEWLLAALRRDWPEDWESIVAASNARPPMSLRVNRIRGDRAAYARLLAAAGSTARPIPGTDVGLILDQPVPAESLPGYAEGLVSVQDGGAQLAAELLDARPGQRVLDACAAPGGKTAAILERAGGRLDLVAVDNAPARLATVRETLGRLGLAATVACADAAEPHGDWMTPSFDCILLDVPCSATGVIRRHPDIKWLRRPTDIPQLCALQARILDAIWPLLTPGGRLLYVTCSLLDAENQDQIAAFLGRHADARERPISGTWGHPRAHGHQLLPSPQGSDGFYFALIERVTS
jgi:16S rRNA (cytosine967-C5)-methyltransferase